MHANCQWSQLIQSGISASAGLLGVLVGSWMTGQHQAKERQNARIREQLMEFYAPLRGMRATIRAKSELRPRLHAIADAEWRKKFEGADDPEVKKEIDEKDWPRFEAILNYSDEQLRTELVPTYNRMLEHFSAHMAFAEVSTLEHFPALVEFVELWNRHLQSPLPPEVLKNIDHSEAKLQDLYADIERHFNSLVAKLK